MELIHETPFVGEVSQILDADGGFALLAVLKATFHVGHHGRVSVAEQQQPIVVSDEWYGTPGESSVAYENDGAFFKPHCDIVASGHVIAPGHPVTDCLCHLRVGRVQKSIRVFGERRWVASTLDTRWSPPLPFERMPICWERAFGGIDLADASVSPGPGEARNPVGPGFCSRGNPKVLDGRALPNFEQPGKEISGWRDHPVPQGFGFVGRSWEPRIRYAGTYDERWQQTRMPVLPPDFDPLFFNGATEGLRYPGHLLGGEPVEALNLSSRGIDKFSLPCIRVEIRGISFGQHVKVPAVLDTASFTLSEDRFTLVWRAKFKIRHNEPEEPVIAHVAFL